MKVKIGDTVYSSSEQPIMIIFDEGEQNQISNMEGLNKFLSYPPEMSVKEAEEFMKTKEE